MESSTFVTYFLAAFYLFVAGFYITLIKFKQQKSPGTFVVHLGQEYSMHWWNHIIFRMFRFVILTVCVARVFNSEVDSLLFMIPLPNAVGFQALGVTMLVSGFIIAMFSNMTLENAWRSGIDVRQTELITEGIYSISRNPSFVGVGIAQIGFFFALPSAFSLICMLVGLNALRIQASLEEKFLIKKHPQQYQTYCKKVPKWI